MPVSLLNTFIYEYIISCSPIKQTKPKHLWAESYYSPCYYYPNFTYKEIEV